MELLLSLATFAVVSLIIILIVFLVLCIILGFSFGWSHFKGAPFVRSKKNKIETIISLAQIKPGETVIDLGSGDGILVEEAVKCRAKAIGVEINPLLAWYSQKKLSKKHPDKNCRIVRCNIHSYPLNKADVIFFYLYPPLIEKLKQKFASEIKPGARIISNDFPISGWKPAVQKNKVFLYKTSPHSSIGRTNLK